MTMGVAREEKLKALGNRGRWLAIQAICGSNFLVWAFVGAWLGGSALLGGSDGTHFFLGQGGVLTEVSQSIYAYSWIHTLSQVITFPLAVVAAFKLHQRSDEPWSVRGRGAV